MGYGAFIMKIGATFLENSPPWGSTPKGRVGGKPKKINRETLGFHPRRISCPLRKSSAEKNLLKLLCFYEEESPFFVIFQLSKMYWFFNVRRSIVLYDSLTEKNILNMRCCS